MNPEPPFERAATAARYQGEAGRQYHRTKRAIPEAALPWVARQRARKFAPWVRSEDVVFEYGVGLGWNLAALPCRRRVGFDVGEFLGPELRGRGIEVVSRTDELAAGLADVVICHHTLEHVLHPAAALSEIRRLLGSIGRLLLFVPYERESRYRRFRPDEPNHHVYSWNVQTLGNLVMDCGYRILDARLRLFGYDRFAAVWADRLRLGGWGFRFIRAMALDAFPAWEVQVVAVPA